MIILGGGDTGSDCLGTAHRQGALHVTQIELMPAPPPSRASSNPWPTWPLVFRTSSSQEEGGERAFAFRTTHLSGEEGRVTTLHGVRVDDTNPIDSEASRGDTRRGGDGHGDADRGGGRDEIALPVDVLILAMGFVGPDTSSLVDQLGITLDARGNIAVDKRGATNVPNVYCAGDAHRGASLIVWAIAEGREVARAVDAALRESASVVPMRGQDRAFERR